MKHFVLPIEHLCWMRALQRPFSIQRWALALRADLTGFALALRLWALALRAGLAGFLLT